MDSTQSLVLSQLPYVDAELKYVKRSDEALYSYGHAREDGPQNNITLDPQSMRVYDVNSVAGRLDLDRHGFKLVPRHTAVTDYSEAQIKSVAYPEIAQMVAEHTGAAFVKLYDYTIRKSVEGEISIGQVNGRAAGSEQRAPDPRMHNDYTHKSAAVRVASLLGDEAPKYAGKRFAFLNIWHPLRGPLHDKPLAFADPGSIEEGDLVPVTLMFPGRKGSMFALSHNAAHRWFYARGMQPDQAWIFKVYDASTSLGPQFVPHGAFTDPSAPENHLPRESIEFRALALFDD